MFSISQVWAALVHAHTHASTTGQTTDDHHAKLHTVTDAATHTYPGGTSNFLRADGTFASPGASSVPPLVGPNNLISDVQAILANTYVHVGRQMEIASTGSIEIPATSTLEITA